MYHGNENIIYIIYQSLHFAALNKAAKIGPWRAVITRCDSENYDKAAEFPVRNEPESGALFITGSDAAGMRRACAEGIHESYLLMMKWAI